MKAKIVYALSDTLRKNLTIGYTMSVARDGCGISADALTKARDAEYSAIEASKEAGPWQVLAGKIR